MTILGGVIINSIRKDSFFINKMTALKESNKDYSTYTVLPEYGEGTITTFNIINGLKLTFNNLVLQDKITNYYSDHRIYSQDFLKIDYCLKGKLLTSNQEDKVFLGSKGTSMYYEGTGNVKIMEPYDKQYESITIMGYSNKIMESFEEIFQIEKERFINFYKLINQGETVIIRYNTRVKRLVNEIKQAIYDDKNAIIRIKTIELFLYEVMNFEKNKRVNIEYYNRCTINKIINIQEYIMDNLDKKITIDDICEGFDISSKTLKGCFKQTFLNSIYAYIKQSRMEKGRELLINTDRSILEIALNCGYSNNQNFTKAFKQHYNITPRDARNLY
ncbi:MAG: AraC family transcriptional regulator [Maledivibacter sp.]|jgi:AraC-like DNA-binding protein|nr:AraC family transcriptional regulator [Maledivibacter sp.]